MKSSYSIGDCGTDRRNLLRNALSDISNDIIYYDNDTPAKSWKLFGDEENNTPPLH